MKKVLVAAAIAATMLAGSAMPSFAKTFPLGPLVDGSALLIGDLKVKGSFTDFFTFSLSGPFTFDTSVSVTATTTKPVSIKNFTLTLLDGATIVDTISTPVAVTGSTDALTDTLPAGLNYSLKVTGTVTPGQVANYGGPLTVAGVSTVPLPGSVAMFGAAVVGLGAVGALRKKRSVAAAA